MSSLYGKATRCDTLYVAILRLWKRIDEISADQNTTNDALDLALIFFVLLGCQADFWEFGKWHRGKTPGNVGVWKYKLAWSKPYQACAPNWSQAKSGQEEYRPTWVHGGESHLQEISFQHDGVDSRSQKQGVVLLQEQCVVEIGRGSGLGEEKGEFRKRSLLMPT